VVRVEGVEIDNLEHWSQISQQLVDDRRSRVLVTVRRGSALFFHVLRPIYDDAAGRGSAPLTPSGASPS
jgi:hypothetical protein